jgi:hypothetical protein
MDDETRTWLSELVATETRRIHSRIERGKNQKTRNSARWELQQAEKAAAEFAKAKDS